MTENMAELFAETFVCLDLKVRPPLLLELSRMKSFVEAYRAFAVVVAVRCPWRQAEPLSQLPEMVDMVDWEEVRTLPPDHARVVSLAQ